MDSNVTPRAPTVDDIPAALVSDLEALAGLQHVTELVNNRKGSLSAEDLVAAYKRGVESVAPWLAAIFAPPPAPPPATEPGLPAPVGEEAL